MGRVDGRIYSWSQVLMALGLIRFVDHTLPFSATWTCGKAIYYFLDNVLQISAVVFIDIILSKERGP